MEINKSLIKMPTWKMKSFTVIKLPWKELIKRDANASFVNTKVVEGCAYRKKGKSYFKSLAQKTKYEVQYAQTSDILSCINVIMKNDLPEFRRFIKEKTVKEHFAIYVSKGVQEIFTVEIPVYEVNEAILSYLIQHHFDNTTINTFERKIFAMTNPMKISWLYMRAKKKNDNCYIVPIYGFIDEDGNPSKRRHKLGSTVLYMTGVQRNPVEIAHISLENGYLVNVMNSSKITSEMVKSKKLEETWVAQFISDIVEVGKGPFIRQFTKYIQRYTKDQLATSNSDFQDFDSYIEQWSSRLMRDITIQSMGNKISCPVCRNVGEPLLCQECGRHICKTCVLPTNHKLVEHLNIKKSDGHVCSECINTLENRRNENEDKW